MGFFITVLVGFILGILFDRFIASDEIDAIIQMIIPTEKESKDTTPSEFKYETFTDSNGSFHIKCPTCGTKLSVKASRCVVCGTVL